MSCGCNDNENLDNLNQIQVNAADPLPIDEVACTDTFSRIVKEFAQICIMPTVVPGTISVTCLGGPNFVDDIPKFSMTQCCFFVEQDVCVQVDILFGASVTVPTVAAICEMPTTGVCTAPAPSFTCCKFISAQHATDEFGDPLNSLSIQICGPQPLCSPQGSHINIIFSNQGPKYNINFHEILSETCNADGSVTVTAQAIFNGGPGNTELANFTFTFTPNGDGTVNLHIVATSVATGTVLQDTNITLVPVGGDQVIFLPCPPPTPGV